MPDTPKSVVLHARVPDSEGGFSRPRLPRVDPAVQLDPNTVTIRSILL